MYKINQGYLVKDDKLIKKSTSTEYYLPDKSSLCSFVNYGEGTKALS